MYAAVEPWRDTTIQDEQRKAKDSIKQESNYMDCLQKENVCRAKVY